MKVAVINVGGEKHEEVEPEAIKIGQVLFDRIMTILHLDLPVEDSEHEEVFPDVESAATDEEEAVDEGEEGDDTEENVPEPEEHKHLLGHNVGSEDTQEVFFLNNSALVCSTMSDLVDNGSTSSP